MYILAGPALKRLTENAFSGTFLTGTVFSGTFFLETFFQGTFSRVPLRLLLSCYN